MADVVQPSPTQTKSVRPPGEVGGHTVQAGEQPNADVAMKSASSRATPSPTLPEEGPVAGPAERRTLERPARVPAHGSGPQPKPAPPPEAATKASTKAESAARIEPRSEERTAVTGEAPPQAGRAGKAPAGPGAPPKEAALTEQEQLVVLITANLAEMMARAIRQSVEGAVQQALGDERVKGRRLADAAAGAATQGELEKAP